VLSVANAPASHSMMSDFEKYLNCTEVQVEARTPDCTRTGCEAVVDGELQSGEFQRNSLCRIQFSMQASEEDTPRRFARRKRPEIEGGRDRQRGFDQRIAALHEIQP
jgi:hypothetical protein